MKDHELINRNNPLQGIEVGKVFNGRKIVEVLEPVVVIQKLSKRKKYFVVVECDGCGRKNTAEARSLTNGHGCPACAARERHENIRWRYNPVF